MLARQDAINELLNCVLCNWVPSRDEKTQPEFGPPLLTYVLPSGSILLDHFIRPKEHFRWNREVSSDSTFAGCDEENPRKLTMVLKKDNIPLARD